LRSSTITSFGWREEGRTTLTDRPLASVMMSHHHRSHAEWDSVPFEAGSYTVTGYDKSGKVVGTKTVSSTGKPATLRASIRDGVGATLYAGCGDMSDPGTYFI
jgi:hypothetical protein